MDDLKAEVAAGVRAVDDLLDEKVRQLPERRLWYKTRADLAEGNSLPAVAAGPQVANLVSSLTEADTHRPCIDVDHAVTLVESSTPGHYHLYFDDIELSWRQYKKLLAALAEAGIITLGYYNYSVQQGATFLRRPGVKKTEVERQKSAYPAPVNLTATPVSPARRRGSILASMFTRPSPS